MALTLNTTKSSNTLKMNLAKKNIVTPPAIDVAFIMDVSGSFEDEHRSGITNDLVTKLMPWGLVFDPNKQMEFYTFSNGLNVDNVGPINEQNYLGFIRDKVYGKVKGWCGGTDYSYVIERVLEDFGWIKKTGFLSKLFGKQAVKQKTLVFVITDGENSDHSRTVQILRDSENRKDGVYFIFVGVANGGGNFNNIRMMGDMFNNVGFVKINNIQEFVNLSDEDVNEKFISDEFLRYVGN